MGSVLDCLPPGSRVAVLRLRSLGDCVLTTPALDILKRFRPDLRLAIAVEDPFRAIFEENPAIEQILPPQWRAVRDWRPALCINFHGGSRSAWMTALSGARYRAGFGHFRHRLLYNIRIPRAQEILGVDRVVHTAEHLASAMFYLGAPKGEVPRAGLFGGPTDDRSLTFAALKSAALKSAPYAILHPFAATSAKTWRTEGFLAVAAHLKQTGLEPIFIGAAGDDLSPFSTFRTAVQPLADIKHLLAGASVFVGNDSGPAHMAAAFGLPVVVIFGASNPSIWGPWQTVAEVVTAPGGIAQIETAHVLDALARLGVHA